MKDAWPKERGIPMLRDEVMTRLAVARDLLNDEEFDVRQGRAKRYVQNAITEVVKAIKELEQT